MFLICGFTITPIAGAELTAATEDTEEDPDTVLPAFAAIPPTCEMAYLAITVAMEGVIAVALGKDIGINWDGIQENWNNFVSDVGYAINNLLNTDGQVLVNSGEGQAALESVCEMYRSTDGQKRMDDKWYFKAYLVRGKVMINKKPIDANQALEVMNRDGNIMTLNVDLAKHVVGRFEIEGTSPTRWVNMKAEIHDNKNEDHYYYHLHYGNKSPKDKKDHLHCWMLIYP